MGQRLNIEVVYDGDRLANAYYHWSAYTSSAIELTMMALGALEERENGTSNVQTAINILEATGARIPPDEHSRIMEDDRLNQYKYCIDDAVNRNEGLLAVTESGMNGTEQWEEGRVTIDIANNSVNFDVTHIYCEWEYLDEEAANWWLDISEDVDEVVFDFDDIPFSKFTGLKRLTFEHPNGIKYNTILGWVVVHWVE